MRVRHGRLRTAQGARQPCEVCGVVRAAQHGEAEVEERHGAAPKPLVRVRAARVVSVARAARRAATAARTARRAATAALR